MKPKVGDTVIVRINPDSDLECVREGRVQSIDQNELGVQFPNRFDDVTLPMPQALFKSIRSGA